MEDVGELVLLALPIMGHLVPQVELARNLVFHQPGISTAIIIPKLPFSDEKVESYLRSAPIISDRVCIIELSLPENAPPPPQWSSKHFLDIYDLLATVYKPSIKSVVSTLHRRTLGIVTDMFLPQFDDMAEELGIPLYVLFTSGADTLAMMLKLESIGLDELSKLWDMSSDVAPLEFPGYRNPVPLKVWPEIFLNKAFSIKFRGLATKYRRTKGILVNTFKELESEVLLSFEEDERNPPVYFVGPVLRLDCPIGSGDPIVNWLDGQSPGSVVYLCFGSTGSFEKQQVEEIAKGIERSGHRFLWSLRRPAIPGEWMPTEYEDLEEALPAGFLERTAGVGKVIGWAPQTEVLAHPAVGAFVSHCGWNSVLESLWFGVPVMTWPMKAEQQLNAFLLVRELGAAVDLKMDYRYISAERKANMVVTAAEVEMGIRRMMEEEEGARVKKRVKELSELSNKALDFGGSSTKSIQRFVEDVIKMQ